MHNKVVIITGASSGIGRALAVGYAKKNWQVVGASRSADKLNQLKHEVESTGGKIAVFESDVSKENDCKNLILFAHQKFGRIDVLINNAGISMRALFLDLELEVFKRVMAVNFWGTVFCTKHALPFLLESHGSVVGVSSIAGYKGLPGRTAYSASKFAMHGFLESLRIENLRNDLHVLIACPGFTASNIRNTALGADGSVQGESPRDEKSMMTAEAVAAHIIKAVDGRKKWLTLTMQGKQTVFLNKFLPAWLDKLVFKHMSKEPGSPFA